VAAVSSDRRQSRTRNVNIPIVFGRTRAFGIVRYGGRDENRVNEVSGTTPLCATAVPDELRNRYGLPLAGVPLRIVVPCPPLENRYENVVRSEFTRREYPRAEDERIEFATLTRVT